MLFFAVALEDFFLAAFFVAFFAAFFAAFFFAMIKSLLQEKNLGDRFDRWLAHRAKRVGLNESLPRILSSLPTVASCVLLKFAECRSCQSRQRSVHEHLTFHTTHESTLNTPTSYEFQKMFQDNCLRFRDFSQEILNLLFASAERDAPHQRARKFSITISVR